MFGRRESLIVAASAIIILIIAVLYLIIRRRFRPNRVAVTQTPQPKTTPLPPQLDPKRRLNYPFFHRGSSTKGLFNWADHPTLINDVVENGWTRFAFTQYNPSWSARSSLFNSLRLPNEHNNQVEETWEVGLESVDFMQKLHFNINSSNLATTNSSKLTVKMNLPLPGPQVGNSFPREAYFEITVVNCAGNNNNNKGVVKGGSKDLEKAKLLSQQSDSSIISGIKKSASVVQGSRKGGEMKMVVGLSVDGSTMNKVVGSYPGSIGFHSNGSVYLAGMLILSLN
ncbi:hypothetical protein RND81_01G096600 [Saponaria officinalis]|uniref:Uncharacterized protein n=1 Tax=Saponaria officinalis TaxID=3572 RepID=A0AAW1NE71_SAPOF